MEGKLYVHQALFREHLKEWGANRIVKDLEENCVHLPQGYICVYYVKTECTQTVHVIPSV